MFVHVEKSLIYIKRKKIIIHTEITIKQHIYTKLGLLDWASNGGNIKFLAYYSSDQTQTWMTTIMSSNISRLIPNIIY